MTINSVSVKWTEFALGSKDIRGMERQDRPVSGGAEPQTGAIRHDGLCVPHTVTG